MSGKPENQMPAVVDSWRPDIMRTLSSDVSIDKFMAAITTALTMNPQIFVECTHESIKNACIKAAYDGLRPDGKEGALVKYYNKDAVVPGSNSKGASEAQWMPMVFGVRKKAKDHDGIIINAEVVYKHDDFFVFKGDDARIEHTPAPMDVDPGEIIASYAIFKKGEEILHREVMRKSDIESVRQASKSPGSPAWKNWFGEMAKKAAVNRGAKSVPMSDAVRQVISRDDDLYDVNNMRDVTPQAAPNLQGRFGGASRAEGFNAGNTARQLGQGAGPMDRFQENREFVAAGRGREENTQQNSSAPFQRGEDDNAGRDAPPRLPASVFEDYSNALMRYSSAETIEKGHKQFWDKAEAAPGDGPDTVLARLIYKNHIKRANEGLSPDELKGFIAKEIAASFDL